MGCTGKIFKNFLLCGGLFLGAAQLSAQEFTLGVHSGALGSGNQTDIAYGLHFNVNPFGWAAFHVDATTTRFDESGYYFSTSPAIGLYPLFYDEFKIGFLMGPGFYKVEGIETKFGLHGGLQATFAVIPELVVGMESRYHTVFDGDDVWNVFLTLGYRFEGDGGW